MKRLLQFFSTILIHFFPVLGTIVREALVNKPGNEMWRIGRGYNDYRPFVRIDWGSRAWRWTIPVDPYRDYWDNLYPTLIITNQEQLDAYIQELIDEGRTYAEDISHVNVVRGGGMVVLERADLWPKVWSRAKELLSKQ